MKLILKCVSYQSKKRLKFKRYSILDFILMVALGIIFLLAISSSLLKINISLVTMTITSIYQLNYNKHICLLSSLIKGALVTSQCIASIHDLGSLLVIGSNLGYLVTINKKKVRMRYSSNRETDQRLSF